MHFQRPAPLLTKSSAAPAFCRLRDVMRICALSRSTIYRRIAEGRFPPPTNLAGRASGWPRSALDRWVEDPNSYRIDPPPRARGRTSVRYPVESRERQARKAACDHNTARNSLRSRRPMSGLSRKGSDGFFWETIPSMRLFTPPSASGWLKM